VFGGRSVLQPTASGRVDRDHAADGGHVAANRIGSEAATVLRELGIEPFQRHPSLDTNCVFIDADDAPQVFREVKHHARPQGAAGRAGAGSAGVDRDALFAGVFHTGDDVGDRAGLDDHRRTDFVNAPVASVKLQMDVIAKDLAGDQAAKVVLNALALRSEWFHGRPQ